MKTNMHFGALASTFRNGKWLRERSTPAEQKLWNYIKNNHPGVKFRRQHPLAKFVVDFYCVKLRLVIEIDGAIHAEPFVQLEDETKKESILNLDLNILRFTNDQVLNNIEHVLKIIK